MAKDRFGHALGVGTIKVDDIELNYRVKVGQVRNFLKAQYAEEDKGKKVDAQYNFCKTVVMQGENNWSEILGIDNPTNEDIELFIELKFPKILAEIQIDIGWINREDLEQKEKLKN